MVDKKAVKEDEAINALGTHQLYRNLKLIFPLFFVSFFSLNFNIFLYLQIKL